jgi:hypothetical protein
MRAVKFITGVNILELEERVNSFIAEGLTDYTIDSVQLSAIGTGLLVCTITYQCR